MPFSVGLLLIDCFIGSSLSLKDKRRVLQSVTERLRRSFNVAVCEVEFQDQWQRARLAVVLINTSWRVLQSTASKIVEIVGRDGRLEVIQTQTEQLA
ncbi:DUF503 domain-containing protein [candidate division WOR-3 bacterium]|nr:DUF503 domain-containing protein [candidate division WOR-3 bacterium]